MSAIEKLIRIVQEAQSEKAETQRFLDRAEQFYAIGVIAFTLALIAWPLFFLHEPFVRRLSCHDCWYVSVKILKKYLRVRS
jgi:Zn2+/Cd2+-exporting ATPase